MAKGDYTLINHTPFQSVASHPRRYGVMFNPSSSRSRLRIVDAGRRYEVRLTADGAVQYSLDGAEWRSIEPLPDPCTREVPPPFLSHDERRAGQPVAAVRFDMIAAGRGRILAKEIGTDRLFHIVMDEIFRTYRVTGPDCNLGLEDGRAGDPPVPGFYMKLDPEYFVAGDADLVVPPEAERHYAEHPASLRLPVFSELLRLGTSDIMLVLQQPRVWYLIDARAPLMIVGPEDLRFTEQDFREVFTKEVIRDILEAALTALEAGITGGLQAWVAEQLGTLFQNADPGELKERVEAEIRRIAGDWVAEAAENLFNLSDAITQAILGWINESVPALAEQIVGALRSWVDGLAQGASDSIREEGYGALVFPAYVALGFLLYGARASRALRTENEKLMLNLRLLAGSSPEIQPLSDAIAQLMLRSRRRADLLWRRRFDPDAQDDWMPTPNHPPRWMPAYPHVRYLRRFGGLSGGWQKLYADDDRLREICVASHADGRLEAFGVSPDDRVWRTGQLAPNGDWNGGWGELFPVGDRGRSLAVGRNQDGRLEFFGTSSDDRIWHTWQLSPDGDWNGDWAELYAEDDRLREICVESNADGRLEAFGVSPDERIWHTWQLEPNGGWNGGWAELYSAKDRLRSLAVGRNQDGRLEVFGVSPDGQVWHTWQVTPSGDWHGSWERHSTAGNPRLRSLAVGRNADGRLEVFGISQDDRLWHTWQLAPNDGWHGSWKKLYTGAGPLRDVAVGHNEDGRMEVFGVSNDGRVWHRSQGLQTRFAIQFSKVLDLGVGYSHWSEQWQKHFGGEIHSLLATRPLFQQERYNLIQYRFLNGPVIDGDAFNDGTCNFYMLVKLGAGEDDGEALPQRYAILWIDEQTYFTQRWRLLHPADDVLGDLFSLMHTMRDNPEWHGFSLDHYWSPFTDDLIDDNSRMAVRRQIVALTGYNRAVGRHEIYTICFNYGVSDHTWRWRLFPRAEPVLLDSAIAQDPDPQLPAQTLDGPADAYVAVNTLDLRDDSTLHVRGTKRLRRDARLRAGRWAQRYLPADCRHAPSPHQLTGGRPAAGFDHAWDFIAEPAYRRADRFYHFGVYEECTDSRCQYYEVELLPGADGRTPRIEDVAGGVWHNDKDCDPDRLRINTINFNWSITKEGDNVSLAPADLLRPDLGTMSMYEGTTRFRLLERKPLGLIAVFYDKRDDELQSASHLPQEAVFREDFEDERIPAAWKTEEGERPIPPSDKAPRDIRILVKSNRRVMVPPIVRKARILRDKAPGLRTLHISFWTPQTDQEVCENIWKASLAALDTTGVVPIFTLTRFPNFVRRAVPDAPLPFDFAGDLGDAWRYDCAWTFGKEMDDRVNRFCTSEGHIEYATSLWFEDVVGHRSIAQEIVFG